MITLLTAVLCGALPVAQETPEVTAPPDSFFELVGRGGRRGGDDPETREVARAFYTKYVEVGGLPVAAAEVVADEALLRTHEIVGHMLAGRPDVLAAMRDSGMYLIIIGKDQVYTDMPEYRKHPDPEYQNERVRGTGGRPTSFGEENLLSLPVDRYDDESIAVHEFCHTIDGTLRRVDPTWVERRNAAYRNAMERGLYRLAYAAGNPGEYFAEIAQSYFDCNRVNNWNHNAIGRREQLAVHDPVGYALCRDAFRLGPDQDWRYSWLQELPNVGPPPARFGIDPWYTKFSWAREFTVLGRGASDAALLHANRTIRHLFAYRHDVLKALIASGTRLVVLGPDESVSDLPEYQALPEVQRQEVDSNCRFVDLTSPLGLFVVGEEYVRADPAVPYAGDCQVIRLFARAMFEVVADRPVDPDWNNRRRNVQQYELRVERLDVEFRRRVDEGFARFREAGRWQGTSAVNDPAAWWAAGVLSYFDAAGQGGSPPDAAHPVRTREALRAYDPDLFQLVHETMAYEGHVDWRYAPFVGS